MLNSPKASRPQPHPVAPKATYSRQHVQRVRTGRHGQTMPRVLSAVAKRAAALKLRMQGQTYRQIAAALGLANPGNAHRMIRVELAELRAQCRDSALELRGLELERLDMLWRALMPAVVAGDTRAVMACVAISQLRCRLLGLDMPPHAPAIVNLYTVLEASLDCPAWSGHGQGESCA